MSVLKPVTARRLFRDRTKIKRSIVTVEALPERGGLFFSAREDGGQLRIAFFLHVRRAQTGNLERFADLGIPPSRDRARIWLCKLRGPDPQPLRTRLDQRSATNAIVIFPI